MNHGEGVAIGAKWLERSKYKNGKCIGGPCPIIVTELATMASEQPDVLGWHSGRTILIEVKVSRSDFFADRDKPHRRNPNQGMGQIRWFLCPEGLIMPEELPDKWGLLWVLNSGVVKIKKDPDIFECNRHAEAHVLTSIIRRQANWSQVNIEGRKK